MIRTDRSSARGTSPYAKIRLSLRADGHLVTARKPVSRPITTPDAPRTIDNEYGLRFCGISTLDRVNESARSTKSNSALDQISRSSASLEKFDSRLAAVARMWMSPSTCHIASRVCWMNPSNPSASAMNVRSSSSRVPFTHPAPPGLQSTQSSSSISRRPSRSAE